MERLLKLLRKLIYQSPSFDLLECHADKVCETVEALAGAIQDYLEDKPVEEQSRHISKLEHEADLLKVRLRGSLPRSDSFMPIARSDLLNFLWQQDKVADSCQDAAGLLPLLQVELTEGMRQGLEEFRLKMLETVRVYREMGRRLRLVLETGFTRAKVDQVWELIAELNLLEHQTDLIEGKLIKLIYRQEELDAFSKYHLVQIMLQIGDVIDHIENAAGRARIMTSR